MYWEPPGKATFRTTVARILPFNLGQFIDPVMRRISEIKKRNALMETTVAKFTNVASLIVVDGSGTSSNTQPVPLLVNAYTVCASNLHTLSLYAMSANFDSLFPPNPSMFTSLETLNFAFSPRDGSSADIEAVSTFFQAVASTISTLSISFRNTCDEPTLLLQRFSHPKAFPKLAVFSLSHAELLSSPSPALVQFLNQHADTLKCLSLQHAKPSPFASPDVLDPSLLPVLPHLETLNVQHGRSYRNRQALTSSEGLDAVWAYLQHTSGTLATLNLRHCTFTLHDLSILLDLLGQGSAKNRDKERGALKSLTVIVYVLSPQMLDVLAEKLPQLESLKVTFWDLRNNDNADAQRWIGDLTHRVGMFFIILFYSVQSDIFIFPWYCQDTEPFLLEMKTRWYSRWSLRYFEIDRVGMTRNTAKVILIPLIPCIPHLVQIDGPFMKMWKEGDSWKECECGDH